MRAPQGPIDNLLPYETCINNRIWNNVGNLLFPTSMWRNLASEEVSIDPYYDIKVSDADYINENYDVFLIPLANAFRTSFMGALKVLTELVKKLRIPCIVSGVGLQHGIIGIGKEVSFPFDDSVVEFMRAVLDKSAIVGVRGECTYNYLKSLGFSKNVEVIGCPSMYTFGRNLPSPKKLSAETLRIALNAKKSDNDEVKEKFFADKIFMKNAERITYIPQETNELMMMCYGVPIDSTKNVFPLNLSHSFFEKNDKIISQFFLNTYTWINYMKNEVDFSFGTRIHGNVVAVLAGTPACLVATDARVLELAEYHNIPHISVKELENYSSIDDIYNTIDFNQVLDGHSDRYDRFRNFLRKNGLEPVDDPNRYYDLLTQNVEFHKPVRSLNCENGETVNNRLTEYYAYLKNKDQERVNRINELKKKVEKLEKSQTEVKGKLDHFLKEEKKQIVLKKLVDEFVEDYQMIIR